ncbi:hypothetical protein [Streptomyces sp. NPDC020965]|uniref:hypothetical protein n=1 Tax=Streptomyces sp. NPDC020965 TaxID=3365105 RepID=UPI0037B20E53
MGPAVHLGLPLEPPEPAPGCVECTALARQRTEASRAGDSSKATDCNVEIRSHHARHGG